MVPERHNAVKVLLFFDIGGSMDDHIRVCEQLFSATRTEFKHLEYFYFHNFLYERVWKDNRRRATERIATWDVFHTYPHDYKVIFIGDATMSPYEITYPGGSVEHSNEEPGALWLQRALQVYSNAIWLNPQPEAVWNYHESIGITRELMGDTAENMVARFGYTRQAMDDWGLMSQQRAGEAMRSGFLARQIVPIDLPGPKGTTRRFEQDEFPRLDITADKLASLKPAFRKDGQGSVTAGNSSGVTDGAAALVVTSLQAAQRLGIPVEARLIDWAVVGVPPEIMGSGPVPAIAKLLAQRQLKVSDIDYFEVNEAFAVVNLHAERELGIPRQRTNLYGGGISLGHPPGATGLRMTITAMHHVRDSGGRYAVISMCLGSGMGMATLIENVMR